MRLLLVVPSFYPESYGGAERQAQILARALLRRGVAVTLLAPTLSGATPREEETDHGRVLRIRLRDLPARGGRYIASTLAWTVRSAALVWRRRREFDAVYVFHGRLHVAGPLVGARLAGLPLLVKPGGGGANSDYRALHRKRYLYGALVAALKTRWTRGFVAVSREIEADLAAAGVEPGRIHPLPNGVELPDAAALARGRAKRTGRRFIAVGRMVAEKRVDVLLAALAEAPGAMLTLVGDGPELERLLAQAGRLGVAGRVRALGALAEVGPELLAHDGFLTASLHEGLSNALLEALAAGVIPVAAPASGVADLIEDGVSGLIAQGGDPTAFAAALRQLMALPPDARAAMGEAARRTAEARFGVDAVAGRLLGLLESVAGPAGGRA